MSPPAVSAEDLPTDAPTWQCLNHGIVIPTDPAKPICPECGRRLVRRKK